MTTEKRIPVVSVVEATHGVNGWHLHVHMIHFLGPDTSAQDYETMGRSLFGRWRDALGARGLPLPNFEHGQKFDLVEGDAGSVLAGYFTKGVYEGQMPDWARDGAEHSEQMRKGVSLEVTRSDMKDGSYGNRTPFGILRGLVEVAKSGDLGSRSAASVEADEAIWHEWEKGSSGRRQMTWTPGLREFLEVEEELTDEELAALDFGPTEETHVVDSLTHRLIVASWADGLMLNAFERSEVEGWNLLRIFTGAADRVLSAGWKFSDAAADCRRRISAG